MSQPAVVLAERLVQAPPARLSALERVVGSLQVDFAGGEGMGFLLRPPPTGPGRGSPVAPGLSSLSIRYAWDMHHEDPRRPRDVAFLSVSYGLQCAPDDLEPLLARAFGAPRDVEQGDPPVRWREYGPFYLRLEPGGASQLAWYAQRPEWAHPRVQGSARRRFLASLVEGLEREETESALVARVSAQLEPSGVRAEHPVMTTARGRRCGLSLLFTPALALPELLDVVGWRDPVAYSGDVHLSSWTVAPEADARSRPYRARVGGWLIEPSLASWPRAPGGAELPRRPNVGPSPCYAVAGADLPVRSLLVTPADEG